MRKPALVIALVITVSITMSYAQTNIAGIVPRQKAQKEKPDRKEHIRSLKKASYLIWKPE